MITVNRVGDTISGSYGGKTFSVKFSDERYKKMKSLEKKAKAAKNKKEAMSFVGKFEPLTKESVADVSKYLFVKDGHTYLQLSGKTSSRPIPKELLDRIVSSNEKGIDATPLIKTWVRFMRNPNFTQSKAERFAKYINMDYVNDKMVKALMARGASEDAATVQATSKQVAITKEGLMVGYKAVTDITEDRALDDSKLSYNHKPEVDGKTGLTVYKNVLFAEDRTFLPECQGYGGDPFTCAHIDDRSLETLGHHIKIGRVHMLPGWNKVNCDDSQRCVPGLHLGGLHYIKSYLSSYRAVTINILVDPMHIGAIPDFDNGAIRVKQFFAHSSFVGVNKGIYHSSRYSAWTDEEFERQIGKALKTEDSVLLTEGTK